MTIESSFLPVCRCPPGDGGASGRDDPVTPGEAFAHASCASRSHAVFRKSGPFRLFNCRTTPFFRCFRFSCLLLRIALPRASSQCLPRPTKHEATGRSRYPLISLGYRPHEPGARLLVVSRYPLISLGYRPPVHGPGIQTLSRYPLISLGYRPDHFKAMCPRTSRYPLISLGYRPRLPATAPDESSRYPYVSLGYLRSAGWMPIMMVSRYPHISLGYRP